MKYSTMKESCEIFMNNDLDDWFEADHDIIFGPSYDTIFSDEDIEKLENLGWFLSDEYDCWCHHC